jgi:hypothetical protein
LATEKVEMGIGAHTYDGVLENAVTQTNGTYNIFVDTDQVIKDFMRKVFDVSDEVWDQIKDQIPDKEGKVNGEIISTGGIANFLEIVLKIGIKVIGIFFEILVDMIIYTISAFLEFILQPIFAALAAAYAIPTPLLASLSIASQITASFKLSETIEKITEFIKKIQDFLSFKWIEKLLEKISVKGPIPSFKIFGIEIPEIKNNELAEKVKSIFNFDDIQDFMNKTFNNTEKFNIGNFLFNPVDELSKFIPDIPVPETPDSPEIPEIPENPVLKLIEEYKDPLKMKELINKVKNSNVRCKLYLTDDIEVGNVDLPDNAKNAFKGDNDNGFSWFIPKNENILDDLYNDMSSDIKLQSNIVVFSNEIHYLINEFSKSSIINYKIKSNVINNGVEMTKFWYDPKTYQKNWNDFFASDYTLDKTRYLIMDFGSIFLNQPRKTGGENAWFQTQGFNSIPTIAGKCRARDYSIELFILLMKYGEEKRYYKYFNGIVPVITKLGELEIINIPTIPDIKINDINIDMPSLSDNIMDKIPEKLSALLKKINMIKTMIKIPLNFVIEKVNTILDIIKNLLSFNIPKAFSSLITLINDFLPTFDNIKNTMIGFFKPILENMLEKYENGKEILDNALNKTGKALKKTGKQTEQTTQSIIMLVDKIVKLITDTLPNIMLEIIKICANRSLRIITEVFINDKINEIKQRLLPFGIPIPIKLEGIIKIPEAKY